MSISEVIAELKGIKKQHGNVPCLIEIEIDGFLETMPVGEVSLENRELFGLSVKFLT